MDERDRFLLDFHTAYPGVTSRVCAGGLLDAEGVSSYDASVERLAGSNGAILDLGCGDGYLLERARHRFPDRRLVGVDMSDAELAAARSRTLEGVELLRARGDALPLADASVGAVVSHMAFMLMTPVEAVVSEIARVLAPGGTFVAAVGGGPVADDAFELYLGLFRPHYQHFPRKAPRLGDKRARSPEGLRDLFRPETGFSATRIVDRVLRLDGPVEQVWNFLSTFYEMGFATAEQLEALRHELTEAAVAITDEDGIVPCAMRVTFATATRMM